MGRHHNSYLPVQAALRSWGHWSLHRCGTASFLILADSFGCPAAANPNFGIQRGDLADVYIISSLSSLFVIKWNLWVFINKGSDDAEVA